ncbi:MAG TPA: hypothetical protein DCM67_08565 [Propionibacteriaceae bacterium]|nr:hypothetical protein [Propionibacteriaceae bacterium]
MNTLIDVSASGAVRLGPSVVCDGFLRDACVRVQTHVHTDHMDSFDSSKGFQEVLMSEATHRLLVAERNADLPYRSNVRAVPHGVPQPADGCSVTMLPTGHMLGSVQVAVDAPQLPRLGYSGDFSWPLEVVNEVDALVLDATYGSPHDVREFTQEECEMRFLELVGGLLRSGPVHVMAHRGTLQRAIQLLNGNVDVPIVASRRTSREIQVYRQCGYAIGGVVEEESGEGRFVLRGNRFVRLYGTGDRLPVDLNRGSSLKLSAFFSRGDDPVTEYSDRSFGVALSNHADFNGTLEFVKASRARYVVTDNTRGGKAVELAMALWQILAVHAVPSSNFDGLHWGQ